MVRHQLGGNGQGAVPRVQRHRQDKVVVPGADRGALRQPSDQLLGTDVIWKGGSGGAGVPGWGSF